MSQHPGGRGRLSRNGEPTTIRILLAEDHTVVRDALAAILNREADFHVVAQAADGEEAVAMWMEHRPDITLMDLQMPRLNGLEAMGRIRGLEPSARVVFLTCFDGEEDIYRGMKAGAKAYLLKGARRDEVFQCIREAHAGRTMLQPQVAAKLADRITGESLTDRELEVLSALAAGSSNKEIGRTLGIREGTVKVHVKAIFTKLEVYNRTEAVAVASRRGLVRLS